MWRLFILFTLALNSLSATDIPKRCSSSMNCKSCHPQQVHDWSRSWHAKSHYSKNEYFQKTIDYIARKSYRGVNSVKVDCANCHNPRIGISNVGDFEDLEHMFGLKQPDSKLSKAVNAEVIKEGINCIVCHKIEKIEKSSDPTKRGNEILTWLKPGIIGGPFADSKSSFHHSKQQSFFNNPDRLCLVCHDNITNAKGLKIANTGGEYRQAKDKRLCVDCHMSPKQQGFAAMVKNRDGIKKARHIRRHKFAGAHRKEIIKDALEMQLKSDGKWVYIAIHNPNPHAVPTGYGGREIDIDVDFLMEDQTILHRKKILTSRYKSKRGKATVPFLAVKQERFFIAPKSQKHYKFYRPKGSKSVTVALSYRLVNETIAELLELKEQRWRKPRPIVHKTIHFKGL